MFTPVHMAQADAGSSVGPGAPKPMTSKLALHWQGAFLGGKKVGGREGGMGGRKVLGSLGRGEESGSGS